MNLANEQIDGISFEWDMSIHLATIMLRIHTKPQSCFKAVAGCVKEKGQHFVVFEQPFEASA